LYFSNTPVSKDCPARVKELQRVKAAKLSLSRLFPVATDTQFFSQGRKHAPLRRFTSGKDAPFRRFSKGMRMHHQMHQRRGN
jgi:hypothetical protein